MGFVQNNAAAAPELTFLVSNSVGSGFTEYSILWSHFIKLKREISGNNRDQTITFWTTCEEFIIVGFELQELFQALRDQKVREICRDVTRDGPLFIRTITVHEKLFTP